MSEHLKNTFYHTSLLLAKELDNNKQNINDQL